MLTTHPALTITDCCSELDPPLQLYSFSWVNVELQCYWLLPVFTGNA